jgi:hypothetical protein
LPPISLSTSHASEASSSKSRSRIITTAPTRANENGIAEGSALSRTSFSQAVYEVAPPPRCSSNSVA